MNHDHRAKGDIYAMTILGRAPRRVLVTGAAGFIGGNLVSALLQKGFSVTGVDISATLSGSSSDVEFMQTDFADKRVLHLVRSGVFGAVLHQAAISSTMEMDWERLQEINVNRSLRLAQACAAKSTLFIYASSSSVYGRISRRVPVIEESTTDTALCSGPLNSYARSKLLFDTHMQQRPAGFPWLGLRYTNVFGPGEERKGPMASILSQLLRTVAAQGTVKLFADTLQASRDYVPVEWVAQIVARLIDEPAPSGVYNVGSGHSVAFATLLHWCAQFAKVRAIPVEFIPNPICDRYQYWTCADMRKLRGFVDLAPLTVDDVQEAAHRLYRQVAEGAAVRLTTAPCPWRPC